MRRGDWYELMLLMNIFRVFDFGSPAIIVAGVDVMKQIMVKEFSHFPNRRVCPMSALDPDKSYYIIMIYQSNQTLLAAKPLPRFRQKYQIPVK